ncbi:Katanin p80 WD40 repeat-containing subunit B1 like [Apostasia shenzhenica]|uniref:Katanin p80 WD40 repeat-containing subunit B1 like n=1 Tax=Apostasia shenzhenica TaxID=1088818 RepID=A0A2H9ZTR6_9ASPA|nr:Katanin p80 WD40 repeat-containing subunit B1 like [Apostasia shenzhenica]
MNLNSSNAAFMPSAVCSLIKLHSDDQYFIGSSMDGSIKLFDLRLLHRGHIQSYDGHRNSHSHLQLGVNPSETFLLSGGEDSFVRIWSIKTSELIYEENVSNCSFSTVCWPVYGDYFYGNDQFLMHGENLYDSNWSWGVWLGSREGLFYMRGASSTSAN